MDKSQNSTTGNAFEVDPDRRFGGLNRLYGPGALSCLQAGHAVVVGVGGVGSWAVEALARSGVGHLTLIDMDHVAESNVNRQIQATDPNLGKSKIQALAERIQSFAPTCQVQLIDDFLTPDNAASLFDQFPGPSNSVLLDCCDQTAAKVAMAVQAKWRKYPFVMAGSAGGKCQPWKIDLTDLRDSINDALLAKVRYELRKKHGFSKTRKLQVPAFYSPEQVIQTDFGNPVGGLNCAGYGSAVAVTATMGMQMAGWAINKLLSSRTDKPSR